MTYRWKRKRPILPNTRSRHDQSRADNDKQQTENCDDKYPVASSRSADAAEYRRSSSSVAHVRLEPERKLIAQPRNYPDQFVDQDIHCHAREQDFGTPLRAA